MPDDSVEVRYGFETALRVPTLPSVLVKSAVVLVEESAGLVVAADVEFCWRGISVIEAGRGP
jgi:hypothetical protein